ncbi:MAG: hypothetical protein EOO95_15280 [Pedobacter sp.]|nr:MAG: hypothetical protein EOO95_15280 [Pedobacter sp.]
MKVEYILCASIHFDDGKKHDGQPDNIATGFVICGRRHHNCYQTLQSIGVALGISDDEIVKNLINRTNRDHQGFVTNLNRHVGRQEAWNIAKANNQIKWGLEASENGDESQLISENLY